MSNRKKYIRLLFMLSFLSGVFAKNVQADTDLSFLEVSGNPQYLDSLLEFIYTLDGDLISFLNQFMILWIIMLFM